MLTRGAVGSGGAHGSAPGPVSGFDVSPGATVPPEGVNGTDDRRVTMSNLLLDQARTTKVTPTGMGYLTFDEVPDVYLHLASFASLGFWRKHCGAPLRATVGSTP